MKPILVILLMSFAASAFAENISSFGSVTFFSLAAKVSKYGTLNFYHYDVFSFAKKELRGREFQEGVETSYFQTAYSHQLRPDFALSIGHIYQRSNPFNDEYRNENRIFQQATLGINFREFTMSHRVRLEERFLQNRSEHNTDFRTRLRYQIGAKLPLRGLSIDPKENYLNVYNEFYFSTTGERNALFSDNWTYAGMGHKTKNWGSFEAGPIIQWARVDQQKDTRTHYCLQLGWIVSF